MPLPKILFDEVAAALVVLADCAGVGRDAGVLDPELLVRGVFCRVLPPLLDGGARSEFCRTRRCLSSGSSSESESSASNASARAGSSTLRFRGVVEDAREWNEGGGELGVGWDNRFRERSMGDATWSSSSSWALTCVNLESSISRLQLSPHTDTQGGLFRFRRGPIAHSPFRIVPTSCRSMMMLLRQKNKIKQEK